MENLNTVFCRLNIQEQKSLAGKVLGLQRAGTTEANLFIWLKVYKKGLCQGYFMFGDI